MGTSPEPPQTPDAAERGGRGSVRRGFIAGLVVYGIAVALLALFSGAGGAGLGGLVVGMFLALSLGAPIMLLVGVVLTIVRHTRLTGAGLLISTSLGLLVIGGVCVALANSTRPFG